MAEIGRIVARMIVVVAAVLFVLALPLAVALSNLRWFVSDPANYLQGQESNGVLASNAITRAELLAVDAGLVRYWQKDRGDLQASLADAGVTRSPFSERDAAHLLDVHDLIRLALNVQWLTMSYAAIFFAAGVIGGMRRLVARSIVFGSGLTLALFGVLGLLSLFDWNRLFLQFHFISFSNELWRLDPRQDALIRLYPPAFFMGTTLRLVAMSVIEALLLGGLAVVWKRRMASGSRRKA